MVLQRSMLDWRVGGQSAMGIYALFYIYRCAKFGVAVFKASMLDWREVNLPYADVHCAINIFRSAIRCAKFGVAVFNLCLIGGGVGGKSAIGIFALCYIYNCQ